jgi:mRNA interferase MazF
VRRGQIWWAAMGDPSGSGPGYRRPAIVISANDFNESAINTVIAAFLTTSAARAKDPGVIRLPARSTGLRVASFANFSQIYTVDRRVLQSQIGRLPDELVASMDDALRLVLALG